MSGPPAAVRALVFDVFGTLVDWRTSVVRDLERFGEARGVACDWTAFVDAWRDAYVPAMDRVRRGESPWLNLDALHGESFDALAERFALPPLDAASRAWCVRRWHELEPWPDVRPGLERLRRTKLLGTMSNGNVALLVDLARFGDLRFDLIYSAELPRRYKPDPQTYLGAVGLLGLEPHDVMLVAAHNGDLGAAARCGLRTAFVARPTEYGPAQKKDLVPDAGWDVAVRGLGELADYFDGSG
ncbi:MAG: haloacid dehalogenase type II [Vulcanimicrobiaceae bacterium]